MKKLIFWGSMIFILSLLSNGIMAADPLGYKVIYRNQWMHDNESHTMKTTVISQANAKFRMESEPVGDAQETPQPASTVWIIRLDKHVTWRLDSTKNICMEQPYDENRMGRSFYLSEERKGHLKKVGEEKVLGYPCDIYVDDTSASMKYWLSKEHSILLKAESDLGGAKYISEATELQFAPQDNNAFEVPQGYKMLKIMSKEELDKLPPVTLKEIEASFFTQYESLRISPTPNGAPRRLSAKEIDILRNSFKNGGSLEEISNESLSFVAGNQSNTVFTIEWSGKELGSFWFDKASGYVYISKMSVFHTELKERYFDVNWVKKFVQGAYRFKPSPAFAELLK